MHPATEEILMHYGMPKRSGRYPYGSGDQPYQHGIDFLGRIDELKKSGMNDTEIAKSMGLTTTEYRVQKSLANEERRSYQVDTAKSLQKDGLGATEIGRKMGLPESTVRSLLNENSEARMNQSKQTANFLKEKVDSQEFGMIDVGSGVELDLNVSKEKLKQALYILERDGYQVYTGGIPTGPGQQTIQKVLCVPGTPHKDIYQYDKIGTVSDYTSHDGGETFDKFVYPKSLDSSRVKINYAEEGGAQKDGLIEIRRGVEDLSLGNSHYAQVRILVDDTHYMKGMAVYSDDMPKGCDIVFNTNKKVGTPQEKVFKEIKNDPDNPFGSLIKANGQSYYTDKDGKRQLSCINKRAEEGDWGDWKDKLSSQFLSKQNKDLIKKQLNLDIADKKAELDSIMAIDNPTIKRHFLNSFAEDCDSAAVHLKAAALPRQKYQVLIPITSMKDNEVYAPNYKHGETVALIRYPHGGTFEIPILKVNNKHQDSIDMLGTTPKDAIGINSKVAERLSGADFDGDTVMVIPCNSANSKIKISSTPALKGLEGFDPKAEYGPDTYQGRKIKVMKNTNTEMGKISNLITDMTLKGANEEELARAVRHSMVVIDAAKHELDYKRSEKDNNIAELKRLYQPKQDDDGNIVGAGGASTLISRSKSEERVLKRRGQPWVNEDTGELEWERVNPKTGQFESKYVREEYIDKNGKVQVRTQSSTKMAETKDAHSLVSEMRTPAELAYAEYANSMKAMANQARKESIKTGRLKYSKDARAEYAEEAFSLESKLKVSLKNAPRERRAQALTNSIVKAKQEANPDMTPQEVKKERQRALNASRIKVGAKRQPINITDNEWKAIQAGAISDDKLGKILNYADADDLRQRATPRAATTLSSAQVSRIKAMKASGYSTSEIAEAMGKSTSTIHKYLS